MNTHLVVVCGSKSAEKDEGQNHIRELRSSFEECLVEKRHHNLPILDVFAGGSDADINRYGNSKLGRKFMWVPKWQI